MRKHPSSHQGDANVVLREDDGTKSIYHAQLTKVSAEMVKQGVSAGDMLTGIGDWNTANRSTKMITRHLKKTKERPLTLYFGKVDLSADMDDEEEEKEESPAADERKEETVTEEVGGCVVWVAARQGRKNLTNIGILELLWFLWFYLCIEGSYIF